MDQNYCVWGLGLWLSGGQVLPRALVKNVKYVGKTEKRSAVGWLAMSTWRWVITEGGSLGWIFSLSIQTFIRETTVNTWVIPLTQSKGSSCARWRDPTKRNPFSTYPISPLSSCDLRDIISSWSDWEDIGNGNSTLIMWYWAVLLQFYHDTSDVSVARDCKLPRSTLTSGKKISVRCVFVIRERFWTCFVGTFQIYCPTIGIIIISSR